MGRSGRTLLIKGIKPGICGSSVAMSEKRAHADRDHTDESNVDTTRGEGTTFGCPINTVLGDPCVEVRFGFRGKTKIRSSDALQNVVVVLGGTEDARRWVRNIPLMCDK